MCVTYRTLNYWLNVMWGIFGLVIKVFARTATSLSFPPPNSSLTLAQDRNWWYSVCFNNASIRARDTHVWRENRCGQDDINLSASLWKMCMLPILDISMQPPIHLLKFSFISSSDSIKRNNQHPQNNQFIHFNQNLFYTYFILSITNIKLYIFIKFYLFLMSYFISYDILCITVIKFVISV